MTTLSRGSLARNSFTFWATKCFFLVLVLLAMDAAMLAAEAMFNGKVAAVGGVEIEAVDSPTHPLRLARPPTTHDSLIARIVIRPASKIRVSQNVLPIHRPSGANWATLR